MDKAAGPTTRSAVRNLLNVRGRGFGVEGILDPFASGLLITATGDSTRFLEYFLQFPKTYTATIRLGQETDTLDFTGTLVKETPVPRIDSEDLLTTQSRFTGKILQSPPAYSNVRVRGVRAHELARGGEAAEPSPREVEVHALSLHVLAPDALAMRCRAASGTYIRSLARDIAAQLGTCGHLTALRRIAIGPWSVSDEAVDAEWGKIAGTIADFEILDFFPVLNVTADEEIKFLNGNPFVPQNKPQLTGILRIAAPQNFLGLGRYDGEKVTVEKVFPTGPGSTYPQWGKSHST
nr:tRNA pseudouridine(55) synthase TruB [Turneriella parva]